MTAAAHVYLSADGGLLCVGSARLPAGLWKEVPPVQEPQPEADAVAGALGHALARSAELSGLPEFPVWEGTARARKRMLARVERDGEEIVLIEQERVEDDHGVSWQDRDAEMLDSLDEAAARVLALV